MSQFKNISAVQMLWNKMLNAIKDEILQGTAKNSFSFISTRVELEGSFLEKVMVTKKREGQGSSP